MRPARLVAFILVSAAPMPGPATDATLPGGAAGDASPCPSATEFGIQVLLRELEDAYQNQDLVAANKLVDFPLVVDASSSREASWSSEEWLRAVEPRFNGPPKAAPRRPTVVTRISASMARIDDERFAALDPTSAVPRSALVVWKRGRWLVKALLSRPASGAMARPIAVADAPPPGD